MLTQRMDMNAPVHKLFRIDGAPINQFEELEPEGHYVAVSSGPFLLLDYGGREARKMDKAVKVSSNFFLVSGDQQAQS